MVLSRPLLLALSLVILICVHVTAQGQNLYVTPEKDVLADLSSRPENISGADVIGDHVNYQTGALTFRQVDIDLPGQGPNITISRTFDVGTRTAWNWRHDLEFAEWDMEIPNVSTNTTMGSNDWKVVGANPTARCTQFGPAASVGSYTAHYWWRGAHLEIPGIGRQELMQRAPENTIVPTMTIGGVAQTFNIVTKNHWAITCLSTLKDGIAGEGFLAVSPEGTKYWFDKMVYYFEAYDFEGDTTNLYPGSRWKASLLVTRIEDRHGNFLTYNYTGSKLTGISASDGRALQIVWTANRGRPGSSTEIYHIDKIISLPGTPLQRTWQYSYLDRGTAQGTNTQPRWDLRTLTLPDQSSWFFDIGAFPNSCVDNQAGCYWHYPDSISGSIRTPSGLTGTFTLSSGVPSRKGQFAVSPPSTAWENASLQLLELDPITFQSPFLREKTLSGPGVQQTWNYGYGGAVLQAGQLAFRRFAVKNPDDTLDLIFVDSAWGSPTEGQVVRQEKYNGPVTTAEGIGYVGTGPALRIDTFQYVSMPNKIGIVPRTNSNKLGVEFAWPLKSRTTTVDGATFNYRVNTFDAFTRPLSIDRWSTGMPANSTRTDTTTYDDSVGKWVLGQIKKETNLNTNVVMSQTDYDSVTALPVRRYGPGTTTVLGKLQATLTYNADGTLATVKDGNNNVTTLTNWKRGIPQSIKYPVTPESPTGAIRLAAVNDNGWTTSITDENGYKTCYGYDTMGRVSSITYPSEATLGVCDTSTWNATAITFVPTTSQFGIPAGHWAQVITTGGYRKITHFDAMWRPIFVQEEGGVGTVRYSSQAYDQKGRTTFSSYPVASASAITDLTSGTWTEYDALDRPTSVSQDSELGLLTTTTEYLTGFKTRVTPPKGQGLGTAQQTTTSYMAYDQPTYDWPVAIIHPEGALTDITRDIFGKPATLTRRNASNSAWMRKYWAYDPYQRLCKSTEVETGTTAYGYDEVGNLIWSAGGLSWSPSAPCERTFENTATRRVDRTYDARNRVKTLSFPDGLGNTTYAYTPDGLPSSVVTNNGATDGQATINYAYNKRRLITRETLITPQLNWPYDYGYNANGHLALNNWHGLSIDYAPNALGQPTKAGTYASGVSYYPNGALKQFTYGNGIVHTMTQNARQLPSRSTDSVSGSTPLDLGYAYDKHANVSGVTDYVTGARQTRGMSYDNLDRLTQTTSSMFGTATYGYNVLDNLTTVNVTGGNKGRNHAYVYDTGNRLTNVTTGVGGPTVIGLGYDVQGNLANKSGVLYSFDYGNRLRTVTDPVTAKTSTYAYDGQGRRVKDVVNGLAKHSQYTQSGQLVMVGDDRATDVSEYVYLQGSLLAIRVRDVPTAAYTTKYQHTDALGTPIAVTSQSRTLLETSEYEPFGQQVNAVGTPKDGPGYTGHVQDAATGLAYMQQRYYDPGIGRFLSVDPVTANGNTGGNFNRYWYANNNPYRFKDPDGRDCISADGTTTCTPTGKEGRGLPTISFPTPDGWPRLMSAANNPILHHQYRYPTPIGNKTPDSVRASVVKDPTPNNNDRPATRTGTLNDATPSTGLRWVAGSAVNNDVMSYSATDQNGHTWEINVTEPSHTLWPGYVLRGVVGNELVSFGEGLGGKQAFGDASDFLINDVWIDQNQRNVNNAEGLWERGSSE